MSCDPEEPWFHLRVKVRPYEYILPVSLLLLTRRRRLMLIVQNCITNVVMFSPDGQFCLDLKTEIIAVFAEKDGQ